MKVVLNNCLVQQNVIQAQINVVLQNAMKPMEVVLNNCPVQQNVLQIQITIIITMSNGQSR